jgi:hypothetical protein
MGLFGKKKASLAQTAHAEWHVQVPQRIGELPIAYPRGQPIDKEALADAYAEILVYNFGFWCEYPNDPGWVRVANQQAADLVALLEGVDYPNYGRFPSLRKTEAFSTDTLEDRLFGGAGVVERFSLNFGLKPKLAEGPFPVALALLSGACARTLREAGVAGDFIYSDLMMRQLELT